MAEIEIIFPKGADLTDQLDFGLVALTEAISKVDDDRVAHGFLGGTFGYGAHWENEVFVMRPYYWGDCDCGADDRNEVWWAENPHSSSCYQTELHAAEMADGIHWSQKNNESYEKRRKKQDRIYKELCKKHGLEYPAGCAVHCDCGIDEKAKTADIGHRSTCALELPNFRHKASGFEVRWYKYIGRGMETNKIKVDFLAMFSECANSLRPDPTP